MPLKPAGVDEHGRPRLVRQRYDARWYTVPENWVREVREGYRDVGARELIADRDGPFAGWTKARDVMRDGKQFVVMTRAANDQWAVELELTDGALGEVRALPPEDAWKIAREIDARHVPPIELEPD